MENIRQKWFDHNEKSLVCYIYKFSKKLYLQIAINRSKTECKSQKIDIIEEKTKKN